MCVNRNIGDDLYLGFNEKKVGYFFFFFWILIENQCATDEYPHKYRGAKYLLLLRFLKHTSTKRTAKILEFVIHLCKRVYNLSKTNIGTYLGL